MKSLYLCVIIVLLMAGGSSRVHAQQTAEQVVRAIRAKASGVNTYIATVSIDVDIPFVKAPRGTATVYFKKPDQTKVVSEGFAMLPKQGVDFAAWKILESPHVALDAGQATHDGRTLRKIKIVPEDESAKVSVATMWVDMTDMVVRRLESTMTSGGKIVAELSYDNAEVKRYGLPSRVRVVLDVGTFDIPKTMSGDFDAPRDANKKGPQKATVVVNYTKYQVNVKVPDAIFTK
jgi:hypothetical protein